MQKTSRRRLHVAARRTLASSASAFAVVVGADLHAETVGPAMNGEYAMPVSTAKSDKLAPSAAPAWITRLELPAPMSAPPSAAVDPAPASPEVSPPDLSAPAALGPTATATASASAPASAPGEFDWSGKGGAPAAATAGRLNVTNTNIELTMPVRDGEFYLGDIGARVSPKDEISLPKERLLQVMTPLLRTASLESLKTISDAEGYLPLAAIKEKGFDAQFDPATLELQISPTIEQRATGQLNGGNVREVMSENLAMPAILAGYVNMRAGADYSSQSFYGPDGEAGARVSFDGALRWLDVVFESSATFDIETGFSRGTSRFVHDRPDQALRFSAGDISPLKTGFQGGSDLLGLSVEKSYGKLQPAANIHPTGSRSFRIERPSNVDVMVNGLVTQRLQLRPGDYDLKDLPLAPGANDITLIIEDDVGQKRKLEFSMFSGQSLLAAGISEWAFSAGATSRVGTGSQSDFGNLFSDMEYDFGSPVITGFYARGLTTDLTANVHLQADPNSVMGGVGGALQTSFGFWGFGAAASQSFEHGPGFAANVGYELGKFKGADGIQRTVRLAADYRSPNFAPLSLGDPRDDRMLELSAMYMQDLPWELSGSLSGIYSLGRGDDPDRFGIDLVLGRNFGRSLSAGLSIGYEQSVGGDGDETDRPDGLRASIRLGYQLNENSSIDAGYDTRDGGAQLGYRHQEGRGVGSWNAQLELDRTPGSSDEPNNFGVNGSLGYIANRAEVSLSQHTGLAGLDTDTIDQRTSLTAGTAIAFADGRVAVGHPITDGFAIIGTHSNLPESEVAIGSSKEDKRGSSDFLGPVLVSDLSSYSPTHVPYDVSNLPVGYDLGAGAFDLFPGYKSGYQLTVGSDYTITAYGALADDKGEPVPLLTGTAYEEGHPDDHKITIFTNRAGRFAAQGLRPGHWFIDMATEPPTRYVIDVPKDTVGLLKLDTLKPAGTVP